MAYPTPVNSWITDAVTQNSVSIVAQAPAISMATIYQSAAHSISLLYENAVQAQHSAAISSQAATNQGVIQLYSAGTMTGAAASARIAGSDPAERLLTLLLVLKAMA